VNVTLVDDAGALAALCTRIAEVDRVALDTEFHNERSYAARLMVVQLALGDEVALIDPLRVTDLQPLAEALATKTVVGHALQSDLKIFADRFDRLPAVAFDTQLAAAFAGYGMSISLADLVSDLAGVRLKKSQTVSDWSTRPLTPAQIDYLVDDVRYLFPMQDALTERLERTGRYAWFEEDARPLAELVRYRPDPERLYLRIPGAMRMNRRELGIMREIARTRDEIARDVDKPLKYIVPDDVMAGIVTLRPQSREDLAQLRRFDAGLRKAYGDRLVDAVARGLAVPDEELPRRPPRGHGAERDAIVACLSVLTAAIAAANELPSGMLAPRAALERIARELPETAEGVAGALESSSPWRSVLIAEPIRAMLAGEVALAIDARNRRQPKVAFRDLARETDAVPAAPAALEDADRAE